MSALTTTGVPVAKRPKQNAKAKKVRHQSRRVVTSQRAVWQVQA